MIIIIIFKIKFIIVKQIIINFIKKKEINPPKILKNTGINLI